MTKEIVMTGDLIIPNVAHPISIPDEKHTDGSIKYGRTDFYHMWFRIDAETAGANFTGHGQPGDRYFHLGLGSAGCFTNRYPSFSDWEINDSDWNTIADTLSKARAGEDQLYVGTITFEIPIATYNQIYSELIIRAKDLGLKTYIWEICYS